MKKSLLYLVLFSILTMGMVCKEEPPVDNRLKIVNYSDKKISVTLSSLYPDTSLAEYYEKYGERLELLGSATSSLEVYDSWEDVYKQFISDTILFFIFDTNVVTTVPWDTIRKNYMILERYDLTYDDLVKMNWTITYPNDK